MKLAGASILAAAIVGCSSPPRDGHAEWLRLQPSSEPSAVPESRESLKLATPYEGWPAGGAGLREGYWIETTTTSPRSKAVTRKSVIAVEVARVKLEVVDPALSRDYIIAIVAARATGEVSWAGAGKKGEKPVEIALEKVEPPRPETTADAEEVTVKAGTFKARKVVSRYEASASSFEHTTTRWIGVEGDLEDVDLKMITDVPGVPPTENELAELPSHEDWRLPGRVLGVKHVKYTGKPSPLELWLLPESWPFAGSTVKTLVGAPFLTTVEVTGTGEDAKPELDWEGR